ncbi:MAG: TonB C-terminal domain-containing protein [Campylobacterota bacterium]
MNSHNERYFFISGLIAFSFFAVLVLLIGYSLAAANKIEQFAMVQSDVVSVSIADVTEVTRSEPPEQSEPSADLSPAEEEAVPEAKTPEEPVPDISDLFAQVKPKNDPKKSPETQKRNEQLNALEQELLKPKETLRISDKVKKVELSRPGMKMVVQGASSGPIVNEYHAKIQGLIYARFHPPSGSQGQAARVRITIDAAGRLVSYKVIAYSRSVSLNGEVDWLRERLETVVFPPHPEGRDAVLECILTAKE